MSTPVASDAGAAAAPTAAKPFGFSLTPKPVNFDEQGAAAASTTPATMASQPQAGAAPAFSLQPRQLTLQPQPLQPLPAVAAAAPAVAAPSPAAAAAAAGGAIPPCPEVEFDLDVVDDVAALEQCQEWMFFVELIDDVLADEARAISQLEAHIAANDHTQFHREAHALKGPALNLHLPALTDITKKAEIVGKQLERTPQSEEYLLARQVMVDHLKLEYVRLQEVLPIYRQRAEEAEAAGEGYYEDDGQQPQYHENE